MKIAVNNLMVSVARDQDKELRRELVKRGIAEDNIERIEYSKRSIDSRKKQDIKFVYNLEVTLKRRMTFTEKSQIREVTVKPEPLRRALDNKKEVVVVGAGPAGLFAALRLCEYGYRPIILERGEMVQDRDRAVDAFYKTDKLDEDSNIQFGEGGAGTYSDGKLNTRIKSGYINKVFLELVGNGAQEEILWDYKPHVGTDVLKKVVINLRNKIISMGGRFLFNTKMTDMRISENRVRGIHIADRSGVEEFLEVEDVLLCTGHSARDTYRMLHRRGIFMENKPFAVGARIEHPRADIDKMQYGKFAGHPSLGAATYNLTYNNRKEERGIFSFCMCPGGEIVNAASSVGTTLVNGMSYSTRDGEFSNSALAVGIKADEFGPELFSGMKFQERMEKKAYDMMGNYGGLYQGVMDFMEGKKTSRKIRSSYQMRLESHDLNELLPPVVTDNMKMALKYWSRNKYFVSPKANLIGPETRTSAPVRVTRNDRCESINVKGLYPVGEGAGYAGGIVSAAVDGLKAVDLAFTELVD